MDVSAPERVGVRPRGKRGRRPSKAQGDLLREGASGDLAARVHAGLLAAGARSFADEEPTEAFVWLFINIDGTVSEYTTDMTSYHQFVGQYGRPLGRWRTIG